MLKLSLQRQKQKIKASVLQFSILRLHNSLDCENYVTQYSGLISPVYQIEYKAANSCGPRTRASWGQCKLLRSHLSSVNQISDAPSICDRYMDVMWSLWKDLIRQTLQFGEIMLSSTNKYSPLTTASGLIVGTGRCRMLDLESLIVLMVWPIRKET